MGIHSSVDALSPRPTSYLIPFFFLTFLTRGQELQKNINRYEGGV